MKKIWISGASGMLGSHFTNLLNLRKIPFVGNDFLELDITNLTAVSDFIREEKITHVINCAAYTQVDRAEVEGKQAYLINAIGPHHLGIAAKKHGARVIHFSTDYVFDGKANKPYTEEDYCTPINAYGMSKLAGEIKLLDEFQNACIIRTSWLFGLSGKNFVETMIRLMSEKEQLRIVADQLGRPTYCQDLAEITLDMLDASGIFHFANSSETSWYYFAQEIERQIKAMNFPTTIKEITAIMAKDYPTPAARPAYSTLSTKKIESYLGKTPRRWQEALHDYLQEIEHSQTVQQLV